MAPVPSPALVDDTNDARPTVGPCAHPSPLIGRQRLPRPVVDTWTPRFPQRPPLFFVDDTHDARPIIGLCTHQLADGAYSGTSSTPGFPDSPSLRPVLR